MDQMTQTPLCQLHRLTVSLSQVDDDKVPSADSTDYFDCRNQPGPGSQDFNLVKDVKGRKCQKSESF